MRAFAEALATRIVRGRVPVHGKLSEVRHEKRGLFTGCPTPMQTARYHSLVVDRQSMPDDLRIDAETDDGVVMAIAAEVAYAVEFLRGPIVRPIVQGAAPYGDPDAMRGPGWPDG